VREAERRVRGVPPPTGGLGQWPLTEAVARCHFKLMAYKDEYEVARLYTNGQFLERAREQFEGDYKLKFNLAPPLLAPRNAKGEPVKSEYGPWVFAAFRVLAKLRRLRGTWLDVFGRTEERRAERALIDQYEATIAGLLPRLAEDNVAQAVDIASIPEQIRGYGYVKERQVKAAMARQRELLARFGASREAPATVG
jgi:indolepyruvate ferredoxin oxidoreductase